MSNTKHSEHAERSAANCIACRKEDMAELDRRESAQTTQTKGRAIMTTEIRVAAAMRFRLGRLAGTVRTLNRALAQREQKGLPAPLAPLTWRGREITAIWSWVSNPYEPSQGHMAWCRPPHFPIDQYPHDRLAFEIGDTLQLEDVQS